MTTVLQWIDAFVFSLSVCLATVFGYYVIQNIKDGWKTSWVNAGIGLTVYFVGHALMRGTIWWMFAFNTGVPNRHDYVYILLFSSLIMIAGALIAIRVFMTAAFGSTVWVAVGAASMLLASMLLALGVVF